MTIEEEIKRIMGRPFKSCGSDVNYKMGFEDGVKWVNERPLSLKINKEIKNNKPMITRENVKELLPIFKAYAEGKTIEVKNFKGEWLECDEPYFDSSPGNYRIKEIKYRPFKSQKECWEEMLKHQPFGWVKSKKSERHFSIGSVLWNNDFNDVFVTFAFDGMLGRSSKSVFEDFTFVDGTPFGIKEE